MSNQSRDTFNTIIERAQGVALSEKEKTVLFRAVDSYVQSHPISSSAPQVSPFSQLRWTLFFNSYSSSAISFALVVFVVLGTGTSIAAQNALPGDLLYAVKVGVNEQVRGVFAGGGGTVSYETSRAVERLKEGKILQAQGKLTPELQTQIEQRFEAHTARVQEDVRQLADAGVYSSAFRVVDQFEQALKNEADALDSALADRVQVALETSAVVRATTEEAVVAADQNTDEVRKVAEEKQTQVRTLIAQVATMSPTDFAVSAVEPAADTAGVSKVTTMMTMSASVVPAAPPEVSSDASAKAVSRASLVSKNADNKNTQVVPSNNDVVKSAVAAADAFMQEGDELFARGKYNEAFAAYRAAYDAVADIGALLNSDNEDVE